MVKNHLKRLAAPRSWTLLRKAEKFITRPFPGKPFSLAMPFNQIMKAILKKGNSTKEVRYILNNSEVFINGKRIYNQRTPVGFMDVISFTQTKEFYMIGLTKKGKLNTVKISESQAKTRLVKIDNKKRHKGKIQINCTDGSNILVDKDSYKTNDTLVLTGKSITNHFPFAIGAPIVLTGGSYIGETGKIDSVKGDVVIFKTDKQTLSTAKRYAFIIGKDKPEVALQ